MLKSTDGHVIAGVVLDDHRFLGRMKGAQLLQVAVDPRRTEDLKQVGNAADLNSVRRIRLEVQRLFEGAKQRNVEPYAEYIVSVSHEQQEGMTPPIILFTERPLQTEESDDGDAGKILVPWGIQLVAIDGETQLASRYEAANIDQHTREEFVPVMVCHGRNISWARQVFHDLNLLGVRPNTAIGISMDARDPLTSVAREVEVNVPFFRGRVNSVRRQLKRSDTDVITITALRGACVTLAEGIGGVRHGARPVHVAPADVPQIREIAVEWLKTVAETIGPAIEDRERTLAAAPTVFAAIGAMGHELVRISDPDDRTPRREELLDKLRLVNWEKGKSWEGIAGKFSPRGRFSVGGSKETAYAVYAALTDLTSEGYSKVRVSTLNAA